jgi:hypothetical protein
MTGVKMMALAKQRALGLAESIENAVSDVKQPGAKREKHRLDKRKMKMHGADKEPRPERGDGRCIQAEQMPPFRQVVETSGQGSVYLAYILDSLLLRASPIPRSISRPVALRSL